MKVQEYAPSMANISLSTHCHNDLPGGGKLLAAIKAGATQVECTINGIGERAGTRPWRIVMALHTKRILEQIRGSSRRKSCALQLLSRITGVKVQPNKAIVGENAFAMRPASTSTAS
jgi:2-isopropylmalate synthase